MRNMKKTEAIDLFGTPAKLANALGVTRHAIYMWQDDLPQTTVDRVVGAAVRLGKMPMAAPDESGAQ